MQSQYSNSRVAIPVLGRTGSSRRASVAEPDFLSSTDRYRFDLVFHGGSSSIIYITISHATDVVSHSWCSHMPVTVVTIRVLTEHP